MRASRWVFVVRFLLLGLSGLFVVWGALYALSRCDAEKELGPKYKPKARAARATEWREGIDWRDEIIYFVLIDRFCDGDSSNNKGRIPDSYRPWDGTPEHVDWLKAYQGGDLRGVINRLDYLSDLGITALWLSPVFDNSDSSFLGWWPYHGYQPRDFFAVDEHFGGTGDLCELVQQAHRRGIKVILDMVCNQVAPDHPWVSDSTNWHVLGYRHWFHRRSGVDAPTSIENWHDQHQLETRELHGMPDLAQENPHVYAFLLDVAKYWINLTNCDGSRLDAVKHAPREFWRRYCADLHRFAGPDFLLLGEVFDGNIDYLARYADVGFNALFDIPLCYTISRVFGQGGSVALLSAHVRTNQARLAGILLSPLLDNHDMPRFAHWAQDDAKRKTALALTFLLTHEGVPMLYYGTEVALAGAETVDPLSGKPQDYLNRRMMPWERVHGKDADLVAHCRQLIHLRRRYPALRRGATVEVYVDHGIYCYLRATPEEQVLVALNTSAYEEERNVPLTGTLFAHSIQLVDECNGRAFAVVNDSLRLVMAPRSSYLFHATASAERGAPPLPPHCRFTDRLTKDFRSVRFVYTTGTPASSVAVAGNFNSWDASAHLLSPVDSAKTTWAGTIPLREGRYRYKFVLDGKVWTHDPAAGAQERDPYGGWNSVVAVR